VSTTDATLVGWWDYREVALSVVIAVLGSYAALDLAERVTAARGWARLTWMVGGVTAAAIGVWSMHYTGMLAFHLPVPTQYDWPTTGLAFLCAFAASFVALAVVTRRQMGWPSLLAGSVSMGAGISGLHYTGMASMRAPSMHHYAMTLVTLSVAFAVGFSLLSLRLTFFFRGGSDGWRSRRAASTLLMGAAISVMHYTGMAAVSFTRGGPPDLSHAVTISSIGIVAIGGITVTVLLVVIVTSMFDRLYQSRALLQSTSEQLRALTASVRTTREDEGRRIARELHDELGTALTSLKWELETVSNVVSGPLDRARIDQLRQELAAMIGLIDSTTDVVKRIAAELRPSILDDLGLVEAIEWQTQQFQRRTGITARWACALDHVELPLEQSTAVFRIAQEALTNVLRHAHATRVDVSVAIEQGAFVLCVGDNGRGISEEEKASPCSLGILGMRERAALVGAIVEITGGPGHGTAVNVRVPLEAGEGAALR
jgi:two-component system, sensor histidine kinase and response regulator